MQVIKLVADNGANVRKCFTASMKILKDRVKKEIESYFSTNGAGAGEQTDLVRFWIETPVSYLPHLS